MSSNLFDALKEACTPEWRGYVEHPFVKAIGDGSLPLASFQHYLVQDYLFLIAFARAKALAIYKSETLDEMRIANAGLDALLEKEMALHVRLCAGWGIGLDVLERAPEALATVAYTRYVLDTGFRGDLLDLYVAMAPCLIGYGEIGRSLAAVPGALDPGNLYAAWIAEYAGDGYQAIAEQAKADLDRIALPRVSMARLERLTGIFRTATRLEADFWQMGLDRAG